MEQQVEDHKQEKSEACKIHEELNMQLQEARQSIFTLSGQVEEARNQADAAMSDREQQKAAEREGQVSSMLDVIMSNVKKIEDVIRDMEDPSRIEAQQRQIEIVTAEAHIKQQALIALTQEKEELACKIDELGWSSSEHLAQIVALKEECVVLKASQDELLRLRSETVSMAAIEAARHELVNVHTGSLAQGIEDWREQQSEQERAFAEEEEETIHEVKALVQSEKDSEETALLWQRPEQFMAKEICMVIDELSQRGSGLDMAIMKMAQELTVLDQRFRALQVHAREKECQVQIQAEQNMELERKREEEREEERARERGRERERAQDRQELKRALEREQDRAHHDRVLSEEREFRASNEQALADTHLKDLSQHELQQLKLVLEQKERLLLSQGATVSALETAVDALKGQVLSGIKILFHRVQPLVSV